jgi:hypothetical protein
MRVPTRHGRSLVYLPFAAVMIFVVTGMLRIVMYHWREGTVLIGGSLLLAALLRVVLSDEQIGLIAIRSKVIDTFLYSGFGLVLILVAVTLTDTPFS